MISVPRDLYGVPLPDGSPFNRKLNSLMVYAAAHKKDFPLGGVGTLKATIGKLLGVPIHYFAAINLLGFKQTVDAIGGVDITVLRAIRDPTYYNEYDKPEPASTSRRGRTTWMGTPPSPSSDRARGPATTTSPGPIGSSSCSPRSASKLTAGNLLLALPGLLDAVKNTIATDVPADRIAELAQAIQEADMSQLQRIVLQPPDYMRADPHSSAGYILIPNLEAIRAIGERLLGGVAPQPSATP